MQTERGPSGDVLVKYPPPRASQDSIARLQDEITMLRGLKWHKHVAAFVGQCTLTYPTMLVVEPCCETLLARLTRPQAQVLSEEECIDAAWQVACGMEFLASQGVVHGALAARSVLLDAAGTCKISNLGQPTKESMLSPVSRFRSLSCSPRAADPLVRARGHARRSDHNGGRRVVLCRVGVGGLQPRCHTVRRRFELADCSAVTHPLQSTTADLLHI